jgi:nucleoside-diphosphate-sugar epimerase
MSRLLIIGGTGFFGKSILDAFSRGLLKPWNISEVIVMARQASSLPLLTTGLVNDHVQLLDSDITKATELPYAEYVIHAAASADLKDYINRPSEERANIEAGTLNYCNLAKKYHKKSKIVYVSSGAVYGIQQTGLEFLTEDMKISSVSNMVEGKVDYSLAKIAAENAVTKLAEEGLDVSIARCFAFVGQWLPRDQHFAIGNFIEDALMHRSIKVKANNKVYRSYMYADDLVEWLMTIAEKSSPMCPIYNVGSDEAVCIEDLANLIANLHGVNVDDQPITFSHVDRYIPSIQKARSELGLELKYNLLYSIKETISKIDQSVHRIKDE